MENQTVTHPVAFVRFNRAAAFIAGLLFVISSSAPNRSLAQAVKEQPKAEQKKKDATKAQQKTKAATRYSVPPTFSNVAYGEHQRQVLDFFKANSSAPAPLVLHIHGGGWVAGDKVGVGDLKKLLDSGISVASINYRYVTQAQSVGIKPPVKWPLEDAAARPFNSFGRRPWNGTLTRAASSPPAARPARVHRSGSRSTTTWPSPIAPIRSPASRRV